MTKTSVITVAAIAAATAATMALTPPAWADPDPHIPDGAANWCPGGKHAGYGGANYCLGTQFADGSFYAQLWSFGPGGPFAPGAWHDSAACSVWFNGDIQGGLPGGRVPECAGGPRSVRVASAPPPSTPAPYMWQKDPGVWQGPCPPTCP